MIIKDDHLLDGVHLFQKSLHMLQPTHALLSKVSCAKIWASFEGKMHTSIFCMCIKMTHYVVFIAPEPVWVRRVWSWLLNQFGPRPTQDMHTRAHSSHSWCGWRENFPVLWWMFKGIHDNIQPDSTPKKMRTSMLRGFRPLQGPWPPNTIKMTRYASQNAYQQVPAETESWSANSSPWIHQCDKEARRLTNRATWGAIKAFSSKWLSFSYRRRRIREKIKETYSDLKSLSPLTNRAQQWHHRARADPR